MDADKQFVLSAFTNLSGLPEITTAARTDGRPRKLGNAVTVEGNRKPLYRFAPNMIEMLAASEYTIHSIGKQ